MNKKLVIPKIDPKDFSVDVPLPAKKKLIVKSKIPIPIPVPIPIPIPEIPEIPKQIPQLINQDFIDLLLKTNKPITMKKNLNIIKYLNEWFFADYFFNSVPTVDFIKSTLLAYSTSYNSQIGPMKLYCQALKFYNYDSDVIEPILTFCRGGYKNKNFVNEQPTEKKIKFKYSELVDVRTKMIDQLNKFDKNETEYRMHYIMTLLISFYSLDTFRIGCFENIKIVDDAKNNWFDYKNHQLIIRNYKTDKTYGEQKFLINPVIGNLVNKYHKFFFSNSDYLICFVKGQKCGLPMTTTNMSIQFTKTIKQFLKKRVTFAKLRHAKVISEVDNGASIETIIENAKRSQHSLSTRLKIYARLSKKYSCNSKAYEEILANQNLFDMGSHCSDDEKSSVTEELEKE